MARKCNAYQAIFICESILIYVAYLYYVYSIFVDIIFNVISYCVSVNIISCLPKKDCTSLCSCNDRHRLPMLEGLRSYMT